MTAWATKRKLLIIGGFFIILFFVFGLPVIIRFSQKQPTCFDNIQNQNEAGVDCGGICSVLCQRLVEQPVVLWSRVFTSNKSKHNVVTYVENPNSEAGTKNITYTLKVYDSDNILIAEHADETYLLPKTIVPIFSGNINTGNRVPSRVFFEFARQPIWINTPIQPILMNVYDITLNNVDTAPRLTAKVANTSIYEINDIEVIAVLYDENANAIAASRTTIDKIRKNNSVPIVFTWSSPFTTGIAKIEIVPRVYTPDIIK